MLELSDTRKIGIGLTLFGILFLVLGVLLFFDRGLLAMGNLLFLLGVILLIGPANAFRFFFQLRKWKGTTLFLGGVLLVFVGWVKTGMIIEVIGFFMLFGQFFPVIVSFLRQLPYVGTIFQSPYIKQVAQASGSGGSLPF